MCMFKLLINAHPQCFQGQGRETTWAATILEQFLAWEDHRNQASPFPFHSESIDHLNRRLLNLQCNARAFTVHTCTLYTMC